MEFSVANDVADDVRFFKEKNCNRENHVELSKDSLREMITKCMENADSDYVKFITNGYLSISPDDPQPELPVYAIDDPTPEFPVYATDDPDYAKFLRNLKKVGSSYVLQANEETGLSHPFILQGYLADDNSLEYSSNLPNNNSLKNLVFDQNQQNSQSDNASCSKKGKSIQPIHVETSDDSSAEEISMIRCNIPRKKIVSNLKVQIMRILSKPYDQEEHKRLLKAITVCKPQNKHIDLRSGVKFFSSDKMGKSLLDYHSDLQKKVRAAKNDSLKHLNLLRGFFFWLENLPQKGIFKPWNDEECLAVQ